MKCFFAFISRLFFLPVNIHVAKTFSYQPNMLYFFATKISLLKWLENFSLLVCQVLCISRSTQKDVGHCAQWYVRPITISNESSSWLVVNSVTFYVISGNAWFYVRICCHSYMAVLLRYSFSMPFLSEFQNHALLVLFQWTVRSVSFKLYVPIVVQLSFWSLCDVCSVILVLLVLISAALLGLSCFVDCGSSRTFAVFVHPVCMCISAWLITKFQGDSLLLYQELR